MVSPTTPAKANVHIATDADVVAARLAGRSLSMEAGFSGGDLALIATAISELARNILEYARCGEVQVELVHNGDRKGVKVIAHDEGPGIDNLDVAMRDGYSSGRGLGLGLPGTKRLMDEFEIVSRPGRGTTVTVIKWKR